MEKSCIHSVYSASSSSVRRLPFSGISNPFSSFADGDGSPLSSPARFQSSAAGCTSALSASVSAAPASSASPPASSGKASPPDKPPSPSASAPSFSVSETSASEISCPCAAPSACCPHPTQSPSTQTPAKTANFFLIHTSSIYKNNPFYGAGHERTFCTICHYPSYQTHFYKLLPPHSHPCGECRFWAFSCAKYRASWRPVQWRDVFRSSFCAIHCVSLPAG